MKFKSLGVNLLPALFLVFYSLLRSLFVGGVGDRVVFLNVGSGDCILIQSNGKTLVVDGGDSYGYFEALSAYTNFIKPIVLVATHLHSDHISGLNYVSKSLINYDVFASVSSHKSYQATEFNNVNNKSIHNVTTQTKIIFENFKLEFLWPTADCKNINLNNCSAVILVTHNNGKKVLLMSDSEIWAQQQYLQNIPNDIYLLKIPHQGSKDALYKPLLQKANPKVAVLSVGENTWGHPNTEVIEYYKSMGIKLYRTDFDGDIVVDFK